MVSCVYFRPFVGGCDAELIKRLPETDLLVGVTKTNRNADSVDVGRDVAGQKVIERISSSVDATGGIADRSRVESSGYFDCIGFAD